MSHWSDWEQYLAEWHARRTGDTLTSSCAPIAERGAVHCSPDSPRLDTKLGRLTDAYRPRPTPLNVPVPAQPRLCYRAGVPYD